MLLDLVRRVLPDAPVAFFDSGAEMRHTYETVARYAETHGVVTIPARLTYQEIARYSGLWGYADPVDEGCPFAIKAVMIDEPAETFVVRHRLRVSAMGLRAEESDGRRVNAATRGELYEGKDRTWYLCPLQRWSVAEVWAYIAGRGLYYNPAYDRMTELGIPREEQRIGVAMGEIGATHGRIARLRMIEPDTFNRLAAEFPGLRAAT